MPGLAIDDIVNVDIQVSPQAALRRSFGRLLILGDSPIIDVGERLRRFTSLESVAAEYGLSAPEYLACVNFFGQSPQPNEVFLGRWARNPTAARLNGLVRSAAQQALANFTAITSGGFAATIDGTVRTLSALNFSGATTLPAVAAIVQAALSTWATCSWNPARARFEIQSTTTGASSTITAVSSTPTSLALGIFGAPVVAGIVAETPVQAASVLANLSADWYGLMFADVNVTPAQHVAVASFIEGQSLSRIYGVTTQEAAAIDALSTTDSAFLLKAGNYARTFIQYSSSNAYAVASIFGRAFTVDFTAQNSTLTIKFKQQPTVVAEVLTASNAANLRAKNCNIFVQYINNTSIVQEGVMCNGTFIDERHGLDWLADATQTDLYNLLYQSTTKVPQTEAGINLLIATVERTMSQAVLNGLAAPGIWNAQGFGKLKQGDYLPKGFYVYAAPLSLQAPADREARRSPTLQIALKLAGAVHSVNAIININR